MKLKFIYTTVNFLDEHTNNKWKVNFTGKNTQLVADVYRNDKQILKTTFGCGHANKTIAKIAVGRAIESLKKPTP